MKKIIQLILVLKIRVENRKKNGKDENGKKIILTTNSGNQLELKIGKSEKGENEKK